MRGERKGLPAAEGVTTPGYGMGDSRKQRGGTVSSIYNHNCTRCVLHESAKTVCMEASGSARSSHAMVVGEAPGRNEDEQGYPFVGRAGQILDRALKDAFVTPLARKETVVTNVVKCRPPANRTPSQREMHACFPFLRDEIEYHDPYVILALGNPALWVLLRETGIGRMRGQWHRLDRERETWVMPTYHPAFVDRHGHDSVVREQFVDDVQVFATRAIVRMGEPRE